MEVKWKFFPKCPSYRFLQLNKKRVFTTKLPDPISGKYKKYKFVRPFLLPQLFWQAVKLLSLFMGKRSDLRTRNSWDRIRSENIYKMHNEFILSGYRNRHSCYFRQKRLHAWYMRNIWHLSVVSIYSQVPIRSPPVLQGERSDHLISPSEHYEYKVSHKMFHCIWSPSIWRLFRETLTNSLARW